MFKQIRDFLKFCPIESKIITYHYKLIDIDKKMTGEEENENKEAFA